jgi:hypothetical protein
MVALCRVCATFVIYVSVAAATPMFLFDHIGAAARRRVTEFANGSRTAVLCRVGGGPLPRAGSLAAPGAASVTFMSIFDHRRRGNV